MQLPVWDLSALYSCSGDWEQDFERLNGLAENFLACKGRLSESPRVLKQAIEAQDELSRLAEKLYSYAHLLSDEDTSNNVNRSRVDRIEAKFASLSDYESWFAPELMALDDELLEEFLRDPELEFYRRSILEARREKPHILSEKEERIIGSLSDVLNASGKTFGVLNDAELDFGTLKNESGKREKLTHGSYRKFMESSDRDLRKRAFDRLYRTYGKFRNTFASTLDAAIRLHAGEARLRNYPGSLAAALFGDNVPEEVYRRLIEAVHDNFEPFYSYMALRAKALGLEKLEMYDIYNPLIPDCRKEYTFEEAKTLVRDSLLGTLGEEYCRNLSLAYTQNWIDVPERPGKRSGAYSGGCYDSYPYVLLNYNGTLNDVFTLTHELGHSMHSFYSRKHQHYHYADYRIFVAEVASTTNEILLFEHLYQQADSPEERSYLLSYLADEIRGTIYRQTMFAEFELFMHEAVEKGNPLTADFLSEKYLELNQLYYGKSVNSGKEIALEWARIPHFYYDFYVYKYATGMSAALLLAQGLLRRTPGAKEKYLAFLAAGDSKDVLDIMLDAGVDLRTPQPVTAALDYFGSIVSRLEKELKLK